MQEESVPGDVHGRGRRHELLRHRHHVEEQQHLRPDRAGGLAIDPCVPLDPLDH
jgi:hypothetical protein